MSGPDPPSRRRETPMTKTAESAADGIPGALPDSVAASA
jgi:hypothetical protein